MPHHRSPITLKKRSAFLAVAASGKKWVAPGLILQLGKAKPEPHELRYGLTASGKVGNAVVRNRARRRLRALVREVLAAHGAPEHDYVLIARAVTATRNYADLKGDLVMALKRLKAWRE
jgi:ribonuclease P protein component